MSTSTLLEVFASLTVQVTLLICIAAFAICRRHDAADSDGPWAAVHGCILLFTAAAFLLPHLRPVTLADLPWAAGSPAAIAPYQWLGRLCLWLWLTGMVAVITAVLGGIWRASSLLRQATRSAQLSEQIGSLDAVRHWQGQMPEVRVSHVSISPFCWQFHRPVIVVPDLLLDFPAAQQAAVIKHELAHLTLRHPMHLFLQRLVEVVYWFHPVVWWSSHQAAAAREFHCDRHAIQSHTEVADYLRSLLSMIEAQVPAVPHLPAGLSFLGDRTLLQRRAAALLARAHRKSGASRHLAVGVAIAAVVFNAFVWLPVNPQASRRTHWSPWPRWSASILDATGIAVRDYEIDGHRLTAHEHVTTSLSAR